MTSIRTLPQVGVLWDFGGIVRFRDIQHVWHYIPSLSANYGLNRTINVVGMACCMCWNTVLAPYWRPFISMWRGVSIPDCDVICRTITTPSCPGSISMGSSQVNKYWGFKVVEILKFLNIPSAQNKIYLAVALSNILGPGPGYKYKMIFGGDFLW